MTDAREITNKIAWPSNPIDTYVSIDSGPWGYMIFYKNGYPEFVIDERPSNEEIEAQWGSRIGQKDI